MINGQHRFQIYVIAEVIKVDLKLDRTSIEFIFKDTNSKMYTEEILKLTNNYNARAKFKFEVPEDCVFQASPVEGFVERRSTLDVVFRYTP